MPAQIISGDIRIDAEDARSVLKKNGEAEIKIGKAKLAQDFIIDTKILLQLPPAGSLAPQAIEKSLSNSLEVLGVSKVNVLYCHSPDPETPVAVSAKAFDEQYQKGRFTYLGLSNFNATMVQEWLDIAETEGYVKPSIFQGQYNLLCRSYEETLFPMLRKNNIHFAAYSPLAGGFLLGNFTAEGVQDGSRFTGNTPYLK